MIAIDTLSDGSVAPVEIDSAIAVSSLPRAADSDSVGASATAATVTANVPVVAAETLPSVDVDTTVSVKSPSSFVGDVILRPASWASVSVQT
ncbi:MAG: hypothetical protein ACK51F_17425, partial [Rhodospirillales bacterium]